MLAMAQVGRNASVPASSFAPLRALRAIINLLANNKLVFHGSFNIHRGRKAAPIDIYPNNLVTQCSPWRK